MIDFRSLFLEPRQYRFLAITAGAIVILDQITKAMIQSTMRLHQSIPIIDGLLSLTYIRNPGAAFGLFADSQNGIRILFFVTVSIIAILFLISLYSKIPQKNLIGRLAIGMVLGGAIGNLIDRVRFGEVVDFIDFYITTHHWPAFNIADSCISTGVVLLMWYFLRQESSGSRS